MEERMKRRQYQFNKAIALHGIETSLWEKIKNITDFACDFIIMLVTCACKRKDE